jgi:hypothetical protein
MFPLHEIVVLLPLILIVKPISFSNNSFSFYFICFLTLFSFQGTIAILKNGIGRFLCSLRSHFCYTKNRNRLLFI